MGTFRSPFFYIPFRSVFFFVLFFNSIMNFALLLGLLVAASMVTAIPWRRHTRHSHRDEKIMQADEAPFEREVIEGMDDYADEWDNADGGDNADEEEGYADEEEGNAYEEEDNADEGEDNADEEEDDADEEEDNADKEEDHADEEEGNLD